MKTLTYCLFITIFSFLLTDLVTSYSDLLQMVERVDRIDKKLDSLRKDYGTLATQIKAIKTDPIYKERMLIEGGIVKKGEKFIKRQIE